MRPGTRDTSPAATQACLIPAGLVFAGGLALTLALAVVAIWLPESLRQHTSETSGLAFKIGMSSVCLYGAALIGSTVFSAWRVPALRFASMAGTSVVGLLLLLSLAAVWGAGSGCLLAMYVIAPTGVTMAVSLIGLGHESEPLARTLGAGAILATCGTLAVLVLSRFTRPAEAQVEPLNEKTITHLLLACPRCQEKQLAPLGASPCMRCRAILTVGFAEPHCGQCNALVLDVAGDGCPQCGGALPLRGVALPPAACA